MFIELSTENRQKLVEIAREKKATPDLITTIAICEKQELCDIMYRLTGKTLKSLILLSSLFFVGCSNLPTTSNEEKPSYSCTILFVTFGG